MKLTQSFLLAAVFASASLGATLGSSVVLIGSESGSACSDTRTDGTTAACKATFTIARGAAISNTYDYATNQYNWFGAITRTQGSSGNVRVKATAEYNTEFASINTTGHGVTVTYDETGSDLEQVNVYAKDAFGDYQLVSSIDPDVTPVADVPYNGTPIEILLEVIHDGTGAEDYAGIFHVDVSAY